MPEEAETFLLKAQEGVLAAEAAFAAGWHTVCARTAYFAAFHAAIAALLHEGIRDRRRGWDHAWVQAAFAEQLIARRKVFAADLRDVLQESMVLRHRADYSHRELTQREVWRSLQRSREFVGAVERRLSER